MEAFISQPHSSKRKTWLQFHLQFGQGQVLLFIQLMTWWEELLTDFTLLVV